MIPLKLESISNRTGKGGKKGGKKNKKRKLNKFNYNKYQVTEMTHNSISRALEGLGPKEFAHVLECEVSELDKFLQSPDMLEDFLKVEEMSEEKHLLMKVRVERESVFLIAR